MTSREGIEIGYCPECRGVWLDRGELNRDHRTLRSRARSEGRVQSEPGYPEGAGDHYRGKKKKNFL